MCEADCAHATHPHATDALAAPSTAGSRRRHSSEPMCVESPPLPVTRLGRATAPLPPQTSQPRAVLSSS